MVASVINALDPIKELYNMYLKGEKTPWIMEVSDGRLGLDSDLKNGLSDSYLEL